MQETIKGTELMEIKFEDFTVFDYYDAPQQKYLLFLFGASCISDFALENIS